MTCHARPRQSVPDGREFARGVALNVMDKALIEFQKACGPNDTRETQLHLDIQFLIDQYAEENKR